MGCDGYKVLHVDMKDVSQSTACVIDHGLGIPVAQRLARNGFARVLYYCPNSEGFPTINRCIIGHDMEGIEKIDSFWKIKKEIDCFVFPDIGLGDLQLELESQGFPVWGSRDGDTLEIFRQHFCKVLKGLGLEVAPFVPVKGLNALRLHLKDAEDKYIKISRYRGSMETFHWRSWDLDEGKLDVLAVKMGPAKELIAFLVFDAIDTPLEIGGDTSCVDGQWPKLMLHGDECKDHSYLGVVTPRGEMPEKIQEVLDAFGPVLKEFRYRNQWSMEVRIVGDKGYFIDPCCRIGLPSTLSQMMIWENWPEHVWAGANGELCELKPSATHAAEAIITTKSERDEWPVIRIPPELKEWTGFGNCFQIDGKIAFPADEGQGHEVGWLGATGDSIKGVIDNLHEHTDLLPDGLDADTDALVDLLHELEESVKADIEFGKEPIPPPETALNL